MLIVLIIIAILLLWLVRIGYQVCANQINCQRRTEAQVAGIVRLLNKIVDNK